MSSNSDSSNGSDKFNSESDGRTKRVFKLEHNGNKSEKTPETDVIKKSLEDKTTDALISSSPDKKEEQENLIIKLVPLNVKISKDNVSYYKITTQEVENSILKTTVIHFQNNYEQQANEETRVPLNKSFITCSKYLRLLLGALSPVYRPQLTTRNHPQPVLRKISSHKELKKSAVSLKNIDSKAKSHEHKIPFKKQLFGEITTSCTKKKNEEPPSIEKEEQHRGKIISEPALHKVPEIKMVTQSNNVLAYSLPPCRKELYKKQYKYARAMKPRNECELKMREKLLKLLLHLKNTAEETENVIKAFCYHDDIHNLQKVFNTQVNKTIGSNDYQCGQKKSLESLKHENADHLSAETKKLREAKHQQSLDISNEKQKDNNMLSCHNDKKHRDLPKDIQSKTFIRNAKELSDHPKPVDVAFTESKSNALNATRQVLSAKEKKSIKIILQKVENRKRTMKMWNRNDYTCDKVAYRNSGPPMRIKEERIETQKPTPAEKTDAFNETKSGFFGKMLKEKTEQHLSLGHAEHQNEKSDNKAHKINCKEKICTSKKYVWAEKPQTDKDKLTSLKPNSSEEGFNVSCKKYNQRISTSQLVFLPPKASLESAQTIGRQSKKFMENKSQNDKEKTENAAALKDENKKVSKSKMSFKKLPAVKRERLRLSRTVRQKGTVSTYCKLRATSQKLPLIPVVSKENLNKSFKTTECTEGRSKEKKAIGSLSNNYADKTKPKETETQLKDCSLSPKKEKPFSSNESNIDISKREKQKTEFLKPKSSAATKTLTGSHSSKEKSSSKAEYFNSKQEKWGALKNKNGINNKKIVLDRAATKAELKEIELKRKQELQALKEKLTKPKTTFSKSDAYYEYLLCKLKEPHKRQETIRTKTFGVPKINYKTSTVNKNMKSHSVATKCGSERQKLDKHKCKVMSQKDIDQYFKCSHSSDKSKSCSGKYLTPMPKYGCQQSHLTYEGLKSVIKMKTDGNSCQKLPQKTKLFKAMPLKKSHDSKSTPKGDKFTLAEKESGNGNQKLNKKCNCREDKIPETECTDEKINIECEKKGKAKSNVKIADTCKSIQKEYKHLKCDMLNNKSQKGSSDASEKQHAHIPKIDLKHTNDRVEELYAFTATNSKREIFKTEQHCNPRKSVKEMGLFKNSFSMAMKHKQKFQTSLQNKLLKIKGASEKNKAEELKAKQVIKQTLLANIHEAIKVKRLKEGFRNNFHWSILKKGIQNSIHGRQLLNAIRQSLKSLSAGFKGSVNTKELRLAFKEGIKHRELLSVMRHSISLPLLFKSLANATKEYTKLKYKVFKKLQEQGNKKNGGDKNGTSSVPEQPSGENCNKQGGNAKHQARVPNKSKMFYQIYNITYEQIVARALLMKDTRKQITEILSEIPRLSLKTAKFLQWSHEYISKRLIELNTSELCNEPKHTHKRRTTMKGLAPFVLRSSDFVNGKAELNLICPNRKKNISCAASKEVKFFQGFWRHHGPKIAAKGQTNKDICSKTNGLQPLNAMTKVIYETDRDAFTMGSNRRLFLNQLLQDFFSPNEHSPTDRQTKLNEAVSEKSPEEVLYKLIHENMHTVNKTCMYENSVQNASTTLKEKILLFFLKYDMIYVTEYMPKCLTLPISENVNNKRNRISASIQEVQSYSHKESDFRFLRGTVENLHSYQNRGSELVHITNADGKPKSELVNAEGKPEHTTATKPDKLPFQHYSNETNVTRIAKYFNSETITGRANAAKATLACVALGYLYYKAKKRSKTKKNGKQSK